MQFFQSSYRLSNNNDYILFCFILRSTPIWDMHFEKVTPQCSQSHEAGKCCIQCPENHDLDIYNSEIQALHENVDSLLHVVPPLQYMSTHVFMYVKTYSTRDAMGAMEQHRPPNLPLRIFARTSESWKSYGHHMQHFPTSCAYEPCNKSVFKVHSHKCFV